MKCLILAVALAAGCTLAPSAPALAARNYDCSKPGNANKAACKTGAKDAAKMTTKSAPAAKVAAAKPAAKPKAAAKVALAKPASAKTVAAAPVARPSLFQRMKNAMSGSSAPAPAAKPAAAPRRVAAAAPASVEDKNPAGAIAQCKDGTYSHAKGRTGACSRHGGVAKWS